ncbi:MAG: exodeoxyribonuclease III [Chlorobium sp.]|jgi:exodeoxyribonuclease-3|uniref:exodeoxyribonuclease III n=1 Tax=Chlorobium sp. TaxID=1095 RepID=UPI001DECDC04|nr:exodeoxyribonuclease III [Chlorobium sp.]MBN1279306.1 exodeoxyribonuclease III [Chlorobiaceae bacterium]MCF8215752.1 exodeoxyribonuclease III [Chlorobium sp.]MCF8270652.1 exodeoxyribonuclease III [Chlorobium sp.]MCF8286962.1 exodeoxyribonuclease III [Chlorobium sp.]MCF8290619.1 exodeoxyribonuclease III [Chlorobium sp.]
MKIASWNINGIRARKESLLAWIMSRKPDILALQEIKASGMEVPLEISSIEGYRTFWNGSTVRKGYSGTGILVRDSTAFGDVRWEIPSFDLENRTGILHTRFFSLIGIYVPRGDGEHHYRIKLDYLDSLREYVAELLASGQQVIVAGDMNVAHRDIDVHRSQYKPGAIGLRPEERAAIDRQLDAGLLDVMRILNPEKNTLFTWWPYWKPARERNLGWRIDCFYISAQLLPAVTSASVDLDEKSSDHAPVMLDLAI